MLKIPAQKYRKPSPLCPSLGKRCGSPAATPQHPSGSRRSFPGQAGAPGWGRVCAAYQLGRIKHTRTPRGCLGKPFPGSPGPGRRYRAGSAPLGAGGDGGGAGAHGAADRLQPRHRAGAGETAAGDTASARLDLCDMPGPRGAAGPGESGEGASGRAGWCRLRAGAVSHTDNFTNVKKSIAVARDGVPAPV